MAYQYQFGPDKSIHIYIRTYEWENHAEKTFEKGNSYNKKLLIEQYFNMRA